MTVYRVYWTENGNPQLQNFNKDELINALKRCEELRSLKRSGAMISFIVMASEDPECTSLSGVADPPADYDWKKRRT